MSKSKTYRLPSPLGPDKIVEVDQWARQLLPDFKSAFPQVFPLKAYRKPGWLPVVKGGSGISIARSFRLRCRLEAAGMSFQSTTAMIEGLLGTTPAGGQLTHLEISCS